MPEGSLDEVVAPVAEIGAVPVDLITRLDGGIQTSKSAIPVMDGPATIIALKVINPSVKIIGSSGPASNGGVAKAVGAGVQHFVPKPKRPRSCSRSYTRC